MDRSPVSSGNSIETSADILTLLGNINDTLTTAYGPKRAPIKFKLDKRPRFKWYEKTHPGIDWIDVPLPPDESPTELDPVDTISASENESYKDLAAVFTTPKAFWRTRDWEYRYESPFIGYEKKLAFVKDDLLSKAGDAWAVPIDGRISLTLTPEGLGLVSPQRPSRRTDPITEQAKRRVLSILSAFSNFNRRLDRLEGLDDDPRPNPRNHRFFIADLDPFIIPLAYLVDRDGGNLDDELDFLKYQVGEPVARGSFRPIRNVQWDSQRNAVTEIQTFESKNRRKSNTTATEKWPPRIVLLPPAPPRFLRLPKGTPKQAFTPFVLALKDSRDSISKQLPKLGAPWRRLIYIEGLASLSKFDNTQISGCPPGLPPFYPYFGFQRKFHTGDRIAEHSIDIHLSCTRTPGNLSANPYLSPIPFHITFLEIIDTKLNKMDELGGNGGKLFENEWTAAHPGSALRRSSFTVLSIVDDNNNLMEQRSVAEQGLDPLYTVLLLLPENFDLEEDIRSRGVGLRRKNSGPLPLRVVSGQTFSCLKMLNSRTSCQAQLSCIVKGLSLVIKRWTLLDEYLGSFLSDNFLNPEEYSKLLFDDGNFTRSRKYFWAIGCLSELDSSIADNIKQWELYRSARIKPLLDREDLADLLDAASLHPPGTPELTGKRTYRVRTGPEELEEFEALVREADNHHASLRDLQSAFRSKLESVKALRDGLFNASSLVESRASTRLGENVKLLTYVSIFYLPLAFIASLWAVPNITESATKTAFIVTAVLVGAVTYAVAFNLDGMSGKARTHYLPRRDALIMQMQREGGWWKDLGTRFEEFKPASESQVPTEWWISVYMARHIFKKFFRITPSEEGDSAPSIHSSIDDTPMQSKPTASLNIIENGDAPDNTSSAHNPDIACSSPVECLGLFSKIRLKWALTRPHWTRREKEETLPA